MAQLVKCLACKHEDLSLDPLHLYKKPGVVVPVCAPIAREEETGGSLQLTCRTVLQNQGDFVLKTKVNNN